MKRVYLIADSMFSPLGLGSVQTYDRMIGGESALSAIEDATFKSGKFHAAIILNVSGSGLLSRFEQIALNSGRDALGNLKLPGDRTVFILSTTKGNISLLNQKNAQRIDLHDTAAKIGSELGFKNVLTVSNACISGVLAISIAQRLIKSGKYDHAVVTGAEELSKFIISGFQSLYALSDEPCKPFDKDRSGISLGEASGTVVLSGKPEELSASSDIELCGSGGASNDANHISGPSRTGKELAFAIERAIKSAGIAASEIDMVSAHGTATLYNDEMEAKAFGLAGVSGKPVNSLKGYFGHTLGAAGVIETIITKQSLLRNEVMPTKGFSENGVSLPLDVTSKVVKKKLTTALKTASGFGGCNAALILKKTTIS